MRKLLAFFCLMFVIAQTQAQCTFGNYPPTYSTNSNFGANYLLGTKFTLPTTATLTGLAYAGTGTGANIQMALYTDAGNMASALVATTFTSTVGSGNITIPVQTPTVIPAGDYWIMAVYAGGSASNHVNYTSSSSKTVDYISLPFGTPPPASASWITYTGQDFNYWAVINSPVSSITGPSLLCTGQNAVLSATSTASSFTWDSGATSASIAISPSTTTTYSLFAISGSCTTTAVQTVTVSPPPTVIAFGPTVSCSGTPQTITASGASTYTWNTGATTSFLIISPSVTTTYSVVGSNGACTGTAAITMSINPSPTVSILGTYTTCAGAPVPLVASGATTYTWNTGSNNTTITPQPTVNTNYNVTGTSAGCNGSALVTVTVSPNPTVTAVSSASILCVGQTATITASGASTYSWLPGGMTSNAIVITPTATTCYTVIGKSSVGCVQGIGFCQTVSTCSGILNQAALDNAVKLYPNPVKNKLTIETQVVSDVHIYNILGEEVYSNQLSEGSNVIDMSSQQNGVYFVKISVGNASKTIKITRQD